MTKRKGNSSGTLESIFLRLEELVVANTGEDAFEEVFKLLIAKLWDEQKRTALFCSDGEPKQVVARIATLLGQVEAEWAGVLACSTSFLSPDHLSVCVAALEKHSLGSETLEALDGFFEFLVAKSAKGVKGQFFTPRFVIELCVRMLNPGPEQVVCDPACGSGGFLIHTLNFVAQRHKISKSRYAEKCLWGYDIDAKAVRVAKTMLMVAASANGNIFRTNSLALPGTSCALLDGSGVSIEDVCRSRRRKHKLFDVIMTNPPFAGEIREQEILQGYALAHQKVRIERDILFVERCMELLVPGGRLGIVLPHNVLGAESLKFVREWLIKKGRVLAVVGLGRHTFLPHTHQKASLLVVQREENRFGDYGVFFAVSERDGKNSKGQIIYKPGGDSTQWDGIDHDYPEIVDSFEAFCIKEGVNCLGVA